MKKRLAVLLILVLVQCIGLSQNVQAEESLNLITSHVPITLTSTPGTKVSAPIKIKNGGTQTEKLTVSLLKFKAHGEAGQPELMTPEANDASVSWVTFSENSFEVVPEEWKTINATIAVPDDAAFGYYYAVVFSRDVAGLKTEEKQTVMQGGTAVLVLLDVEVPNAKRDAVIESFTTESGMYEFLPSSFNVKVKNTGNIHVAPRGNIFINHGDENDIAILEVNESKGNVLPDSSRIFQAQWTDGFPFFEEEIQDGKVVLDDDGNQKKKLRWDFSKASSLRFGKYSAKVVLVYDDGERQIPIEGETSFWVIPWRLLAGGLVIAFLLFMGLRSTFRNIFKKKK